MTFFGSVVAAVNPDGTNIGASEPDVYIYGGTAGATVTFTAGSAGTSFGQCNGILL